MPHLPGFFPGVARGARPPGTVEIHPPGVIGPGWCCAEGPHAAPEFAGRRAPLALLVAQGRDPLAGPAETRWADPFHATPLDAEAGAALLALWRARAAERAGIACFLGMDGWKRAATAIAFARPGPPIPFARDAAQALALARATGGAIAAWATRLPAGFAARCAAAGVLLLLVEDGFLRSAGLGVNFIPAASLAVDPLRPHYDPAGPSGLERILAEADFDPALLARAAALRAAIVAQGVTKYNLGAAAPRLRESPGRRRILVPGQVEDDASIRLGAGAIRTNLGLLAAARAAEPGAFIAFRPHPDVTTGYRRGLVTRREALRFADCVVSGGDIGGAFGEFDSLHTMTSLAGFEALLRGLTVTCWGQPFYAGWGLTEDRAPLPRRARRLSLDALVAGALILYPRDTDPVTGLPCGPELLLERIAEGRAWTSSARPAWLGWWRVQGMALKLARQTGVWRR